MLGFMIDDRPIVFVRDHEANVRFLRGIDCEYWDYQGAAHGAHFEGLEPASRQRAATALRVAYGQGVETLLAMLVALAQAPQFPLGWMMAYTNRDLRSAVRKIHARRPILSALKRSATWDSISHAVHEFVPHDARAEMTKSFATAWSRFADEFLTTSFEPEYNSLKHGMRNLVGGFSVAIGPEKRYGAGPSKPEDMQSIGNNEYGSTFWLPAERVANCQRTFQLTRHASRAWVPDQFIHGLRLIRMSMRNVVSRLLIVAGVASQETKFEWPADAGEFVLPWKKRPAITDLSMGSFWELPEWREPTEDEIRQTYAANGSGPSVLPDD